MPNIYDFVNAALSQNPNLANNPDNQNLVNMIRDGKNGQGEQYVTNICNSLGMSPQEAAGQAAQFLRGKFPNLPF